MSKKQGYLQHLRKWGLLGLLGLGLAIALKGLLFPAPPAPPVSSSYALSQLAPFNQVSHFPLPAQPSPATLDPWYRPVAEWTGRLILPAPTDYAEDTRDWAWLEIHSAPQPDLIGQIVKLTWQDSPRLRRYLDAVTVDIVMGEAAAKAQRKGDVVPTRLDGRRAVGPLQSLAGARPQDDVFVRLPEVILTEENRAPVLALGAVPVQISGWLEALVKLEGLAPSPTTPEDCPGSPPCPSDRFRVRHYNPASQQFDGLETVIRIPQQPRDRNGRFLSTPRDLLASPAGSLGWYVYGAFDAEGIFTVQSLKPRSLVQLRADQIILGQAPSRNFIAWQNWREVEHRKGTLQRTLLAPTATTTEEALAAWQVGDRGLLLHIFGGIGGELAEGGMPGTVTGHFSYGLATVVRDRFTQEPQFDIVYYQIYGHNPNAIISGAIDWSAYTGNLERGWLGSRPIGDVIVKLNTLTEQFEIGEQVLSPLQNLLLETQIIAARYRTGDGSGVAPVTPATSCVQDSSQALYIAIETLRQQAINTPELAQWLADHPNDQQVQDFWAFVSLGRDLEGLLVPYGVVRRDWKNNAQKLAGVSRRGQFVSSQNLVNVVLSWRSMMPRRAHDDLSQIFLRHGAQLWVLRTNQVGGWDPSILPIAPTSLLGKWPVVGTLLIRLSDAMSTPVTWRTVGIAIAALVGYAMIAIPWGIHTRFLQARPLRLRYFAYPGKLLWLFFLPACVEESLFRVFLLPHPLEGVPLERWLLWALLSTVIFVIYHPLNAWLLYPPGRETFWDRRFLVLVAGLGLLCAFVYQLTGSFWAIACIHWAVVVVWLQFLGGNSHLFPEAPYVREKASTS